MITANRDILGTALLGLMHKAKGLPALQDLFADKRSDAEKAKRPPTAGTQVRRGKERWMHR